MLVGFCCILSATVAAQNSQDVASMENGKLIYEQNCLACHQADGSGVPNLAPPLVEGIFVKGDKTKLIKLVLNGLQGVDIKGEVYANPMPAFDYLSDNEIADVLTFVRGNFKNREGPVTSEEVKAQRNK